METEETKLRLIVCSPIVKDFHINVSNKLKIDYVKEKIYNLLNSKELLKIENSKQMNLFYNGKMLNQNRTLFSYGIKNETKINLIFKRR